jgi:hypothetical protein
MTSSFIIKKLDENKRLWGPQLPTSTLGGIEDRYLKIQGDCHPDFTATPIGHPLGAKLCVRRQDTCGRAIGDTLEKHAKQEVRDTNGYFRGCVNLYDVRQRYPTQDWNPQYYSDRRTPWEADLVRSDHIHDPIRYNGTGIELLRTPHQLLDKDNKYYEYKLSFTPVEDRKTGMRVATSWNDVVPPYKYNVTKLHQDFVSWKRETEYLEHPQNGYDTTYFKRVV